VSEPFEPDPAVDAQPQATIAGEPGPGEALPARLGQARIVSDRAAPAALPERHAALSLPAVQAAAVAAGGFVAGVAVVGLVHRRQRRAPKLAKGRRGARSVSSGGARGNVKAGELLQIVGSRSLLVDVHLLGGRGGDR
jgi:hypothetical protein